MSRNRRILIYTVAGAVALTCVGVASAIVLRRAAPPPTGDLGPGSRFRSHDSPRKAGTAQPGRGDPQPSYPVRDRLGRCEPTGLALRIA